MTKPIVIIDDSAQERDQFQRQIALLQEDNHRLKQRADASDLEVEMTNDELGDLRKVATDLAEARRLLEAVLLVYGELGGVRQFLDSLPKEEDA